ncbi:MAG: ABC transporter permease subunit [Acetobacteraceae bacterium]
MMLALWNELPRFLTGYNAVFLLTALLNTLLLSVVGCAVGLALGLLLAVVRSARAPGMAIPRACAWAFVEFFRRLPPLVVLLLAFFTAGLVRVDLTLLQVALIGLCLVATASLSEIVRGGIASVHPNQWDSAAALNFGYLRSVFTVILPQAWTVILPPAISFMLLFIKDTAFASQLGTLELTYAGKVLVTKGFSATLSYGSVLLLYFVLSYALARLGLWLENRLALPANH